MLEETGFKRKCIYRRYAVQMLIRQPIKLYVKVARIKFKMLTIRMIYVVKLSLNKKAAYVDNY